MCVDTEFVEPEEIEENLGETRVRGREKGAPQCPMRRRIGRICHKKPDNMAYTQDGWWLYDMGTSAVGKTTTYESWFHTDSEEGGRAAPTIFTP